MMATKRRLSSYDARQRFLELRQLWHSFNPFAIQSVADEYDGLASAMQRLLQTNASELELIAFVNKALQEYPPLPVNDVIQFVARCQGWFQQKWFNTVA
jgi:hypothetical protein